MPLSNAEQFLLELINRARLDPTAEATRYGIELNASLSPGTLNGQAKQVLAPNAMLEKAATDHGLWMLATDTFSHTGAGGSQPWDRARAAGYSWSNVGENISFRGTTAPSFDLEAYILAHHQGLFLSSGHRTNILDTAFKEIGLAQETGDYTTNGTTYNSSFTTELFGTSGSKSFVTGAAYTDSDADAFYSMGEGVGGVSIASGLVTTTTAASGGYALALTAGAAVAVTGNVAGRAFSVTVDLSHGNVKLDIVGGSQFLTSGNLTLGTGVSDARLLGVGGLWIRGNAAGNVLDGNSGANLLLGAGGADLIRGGLGNDKIGGGDAADRLYGNAGRDVLSGGNGDDILSGGTGADRLSGEAGNDTLTGDAGADQFVFVRPVGADVVADFRQADGDRLLINDALWSAVLTTQQVVQQFAQMDAGDVVFDFGAGGTIRLDGITSTAGLWNAIDLL